jgi:hypothetical protein
VLSFLTVTSAVGAEKNARQRAWISGVPVEINQQIGQVQETHALVLRGNYYFAGGGLVAARQSAAAEVTVLAGLGS